MSKRFIAFPAIFLSLFVAPGYAVPHLHPELYPNAKPCHMKQFSPAQIKLAGSLQAAIISNATGTKNIAVILVRFPSAGTSTSGPSNGNITNVATFDAYFASMASYYQEVSAGQITLKFAFFGTGTNVSTGSVSAVTAGGGYPLSNPMEYYGCGDVDSGCSGVSPTAPPGLGGAYLIHDALIAARSSAAAGPTSKTSGGTFDGVLVMHAGHGNETTAINGDIWSALYEEASVIGAGGTTFTDGAEFPELENTDSIPPVSSPLGVMCHEFGHMLTLPDLYNTAVLGGTSVVGKWDLMDAGPYLGPYSAGGTNPAHMGAWDRKYLGWETPQPLTSQASMTLHPVTQNAKTPTMLYLGGPTEYFLVEYRSQTAGAFDQQIPGTGILIWHIDDTITAQRGFNGPNPSTQNTINTGSPHYGVSVVTADGVTLSNANQGTSNNLFPIGRSKFDAPLSNLFDGTPTGIILANIQGVGTNAVAFDAASLSGTDGVSILKLTSYPNPAGPGYPHPSGPGHATIQFQLSKPANDYQINIYTLSGDLVRKLGKNDIAFQLLNRSTDDKFIYEYVWDLTNGDGTRVAPGVYLLLARADGQTKSAKAVIIR